MPPHLETPELPECGLVKEKCMYRELLRELREAQDRGEPGSLGPVEAFRGLAFFDHFADLRPSVRDLLEREHRLVGYGEYFVCGDLHGDLLVCLGVLRLAGLIDENANWVPREDPKNTPARCFVQLGDVIDRGGRGSASVDTSHMPREEMNMLEYLHALDLQARAAGDRVVSVSGNHEYYALRASFDEKLAAQWDFETKETACPFPEEKVSRRDVFRRPGALHYFAFMRPPLMISSLHWLFCHGDVPITPLRKFLRSHKTLIRRLHKQTRVSFAECVVGATNMLWAAHILALGGDTSLFDQLKPALPESDKPGKLAGFPMSVCDCRTLARMGEREDVPCDCDGRVEQVAKELALDWSVSGGIALGHTVQAELSSKCAGKVQLLDLGMSEAFRGFNKTHKIGVLRINAMQEIEHIQR